MKPDNVFALENAAWPALLLDEASTVLRANDAAVKLFGPALEGQASRLSAIWAAVYQRPKAEGPAPDVEQDLYGGFVGNGDRRRLDELRAMTGTQLASARTGFDDARLTELLFRYRARNFAATLTPEEQARWLQHRTDCLLHGQGGALTAQALFERIDALSETADERAEEILGALYDWAETVVPEQ